MQRPNSIATKHAGRVLAEIGDLALALEPYFIDPSSDEGICISFRRQNRYADIECFNNGEILAATKVDGEDPTIWELSPENIEETIAKINLFILS